MKSNISIERNKDLVEIMSMMAEVAKKFNDFVKDINDEDLEDSIVEIKDGMASCISNVSAMENYFYTSDLINYTVGETIPTIDMAKAG